MGPADALRLARVGDLVALSEVRLDVGEAVKELATRGDADSALELFGRAWRIWLTSGELAEGSTVAAAALGAPEWEGSPSWRSRALYGDGLLAFRSGDVARSQLRNEEALSVAHSCGDVRGECEALTGLARLALRASDYDTVVALASQGREAARSVEDPEAEASPLHLLAAGLRLQGNYPEARELYLESLALNEQLGNEAWQAMELDCLGWVELHMGNVAEAEDRFRDRDSRLGDDPYANAWSRLTWAAVAAVRGEGEEGGRRYEEAAQALSELANELDPDDQAEFDWVGAQLAALGV